MSKTLCSKQARYLKFKWLQRDLNSKPLNSETNTQSFSKTSQVWLNRWVFVYELSGCGFESRCSHLTRPHLTELYLWLVYFDVFLKDHWVTENKNSCFVVVSENLLGFFSPVVFRVLSLLLIHHCWLCISRLLSYVTGTQS